MLPEPKSHQTIIITSRSKKDRDRMLTCLHLDNSQTPMPTREHQFGDISHVILQDFFPTQHAFTKRH